MAKPFHESILDFLSVGKVEYPEELRQLGEIILGTVIPAGHDKILKAWTEVYESFGGLREDQSPGLHQKVIAHIAQQRQEAQARAAAAEQAQSNLADADEGSAWSS